MKIKLIPEGGICDRCKKPALPLFDVPDLKTCCSCLTEEEFEALPPDPDEAHRHVDWRQVDHKNTWEGTAPMSDLEYRKTYDELLDLTHYYTKEAGGRWAYFATIKEA